jgi:hypothetical protein
MAQITDLSDLINRSTGGSSSTPQNVFWHKNGRIAGAGATAPIVARLASLWRYEGQPGGGAVPTTVEAPTNATAGALPFTNPGSGRQAWMTQAWAIPHIQRATTHNYGTLILYDRLLHIGGLSGTTTTAQTVGGTITRNTTGAGNFAMAEIYTAIGSTARTITMNYTNQSNTSGQISTAVNFGGTGFLEATRAILMPLQSGDTGIRAIANVTIGGGTTGTAGDFGITICKPLAYMTFNWQAPIAGWRDFTTGLPTMPEIEANACLSLLFNPMVAGAAAVPEFVGGYGIVDA